MVLERHGNVYLSVYCRPFWTHHCIRLSQAQRKGKSSESGTGPASVASIEDFKKTNVSAAQDKFVKLLIYC